MTKFRINLAISALMLGLGMALPAAAETFSFSTGDPTNFMASATRPIPPVNSRSSWLTISFSHRQPL